MLTVAFAYVGGVLAEQNRREIEFSSGAVMTNTTVLVHDASAYQQQMEAGQPRGILAGMGSLFHLPSRHKDYPAVTAGIVHRRHRDPWAYASEVHYAGEDEAAREYMLPPPVPVMAQGSRDFSRRNKTRALAHQSDTWKRKQKRRGAPNYSAKPRFNYPQYESRSSFDNAG